MPDSTSLVGDSSYDLGRAPQEDDLVKQFGKKRLHDDELVWMHGSIEAAREAFTRVLDANAHALTSPLKSIYSGPGSNDSTVVIDDPALDRRSCEKENRPKRRKTCDELKEKRATAVEEIKNRTAYQNYLAKVAKEDRQVDHPQTPRPDDCSMSKRAWETKMYAWRKALEPWDTKEDTKKLPTASNSRISQDKKFNANNDSRKRVCADHGCVTKHYFSSIAGIPWRISPLNHPTM